MTIAAERVTTSRRRRVGLVMTPLVDVIFLLLIFFMLSSQLSPISLIPLGGGVRPTAAAAQSQTPARIDLFVSVGAGARIRVNGQPVGVAALPAVLADYRRGGIRSVVIAPTRTATIQDVVTVFELARTGGYDTVAIRRSW
jgi:biopolymer transport protein ExbD